MVTKGKCRGNGGQLADYLLSSKNDRAEVLEVTGTSNPADLKSSLLEMALTATGTKSKAGLYHAQINPDPKEPLLTAEQWQQAADILAKSLGLEGQRRAIVIHEKDGRTHAHIVFERYQEGKGKNGNGILWDDKDNYQKHQQASRSMEKAFNHERTPEKADLKHVQNERKIDVKETLTALWEKHTDPAEFVKAARGLGYEIAAGEERRPFKVITPEGRSLDLVRQITTAKTKDVAERLNAIRKDLWTEKEALKLAQEREQEQAAAARAKTAEEKAQRKAQEATKEVKPYKPTQQPEKLPEPAQNRLKAISDLAQFKTNAAATKAEPVKQAEQTAQKLPEKQPEKPQPAPPIDEKANRLHQLGQFKANAPQPPQKATEKAEERPAANDNQLTPPKLPEAAANDNEKPKAPLTEKERFEAKLKALKEQEEATRREIERRKQLTDEQRKAEDKARFEAKLKEMQEQEQTRQRQRGLEW